jgi:hypothetical protein
MSRSNGFGFDDGNDYVFDERSSSSNFPRSTLSTATKNGPQQAVATLSGPSTATVTVGVDASAASPFTVMKGAEKDDAWDVDWALTTVIAVFYPLLIIKVCEAIWPPVSTANADPTLAAKLEKDAVVRGNCHYILAIVCGILGILISLVLIKYRQTSRSAALGVAYGGLFTLLYGVVTNQHKFTALIQAFILGALLCLFIFLPRMTHGVLFNGTTAASENSSASSAK